MEIKDKPIGIFDTGVGGLTVLGTAAKLLPAEEFIYFGDSKNAPYGVKEVEEARRLTFNAVDFLLSKEVKAVVIACNTATSAAIEQLRRYHKNKIIIGMEPALKPAVELNRKGNIVIMATPMTLAEKKFNNLMKFYEKEASIIPLPCAGLVELIESGILEGPELDRYLEEKLNPIIKEEISSIVLGCTHYPFVKKAISKIVGEEVPIIDGSEGTVKQLKRQLELNDTIRDGNEKGKITMFNSEENKNMIELSYQLLEKLL